MARFRMSPTDRLIADVKANKPSVTLVDLSGQAVFQMKSTEKVQQLCEAIRGNTSVTELKLKDCAINDEGCTILGTMLETNESITNIDLSQNMAIKEDGICALAKSLKKNETLLQMDLMGMAHLGKSEKVLSTFIDMYDANITLKKVIWRLDHPLAHTVARLVTRNNSIHRRKSQNKPFDDLLPDCMKNADGLSRKSHLGRGTELLAAAKEVEVPSSIQTTEPSKSEADAENEKKAQTIVPPEPDKEEAALQPDQTQPSTTDEDSEAPVANVPVDVPTE